MVTDSPVDDRAVDAILSWLGACHGAALREDGSLAVAQPAAMADAIPQEFARADFRFRPEDPYYGATYPHHFVARVHFAPDFSHRAVTLEFIGAWAGEQLWVDGRRVDGPADHRGVTYFERVRWLDSRYLTVLVGQPEHPLSDRLVNDALGSVRGIAIYDAADAKTVLVLPESTESWTEPYAARRGDVVDIHRDRASFERGEKPLRTIEL